MTKDIVKLSELLKNVCLYYDFAKPTEKEAIIKLIFSELTIIEDTLEYKCKRGFQALENRFISVCDPTGSRSLQLQYRFPIFSPLPLRFRVSKIRENLFDSPTQSVQTLCLGSQLFHSLCSLKTCDPTGSRTPI